MGGGLGGGEEGVPGGEGKRGQMYLYHTWQRSYDRRASHPCNAQTEHVGFALTRKALLAPKRSEIDARRIVA